MDEFIGIEFCFLILFPENYQHTDSTAAHAGFCSGKIRGDLKIQSLDQTHTHLPLFRASKQHMQEKMPSRNTRSGPLIKHMPMHSWLAEKAERIFSKIPTLLLRLHSQLAGIQDHNTAIF